MAVMYCKLEIFLPEEDLPALEEALLAADAGHIGRYSGCFSYSPVTGRWRAPGMPTRTWERRERPAGPRSSRWRSPAVPTGSGRRWRR